MIKEEAHGELSVAELAELAHTMDTLPAEQKMQATLDALEAETKDKGPKRPKRGYAALIHVRGRKIVATGVKGDRLQIHDARDAKLSHYFSALGRCRG
jgi:hypothetical protein